MKKINVIFLCVVFCMPFSMAQNLTIDGEIWDKETKEPIEGAIVSIPETSLHVQTDSYGYFKFTGLKNNTYTIKIDMLGYEDHSQQVKLEQNTHLDIYLTSLRYSLNGLTIRTKAVGRETSLSTETVGKTFLLENTSSSLAKTLSKLPGMSSMDIGVGISKPVIRGLGFNRLAVIDKGVKQQDQQWGADHGLEIDQYDVENVVIHKGPTSLQFGSDAIGGAIEILPVQPPSENLYYGDVLFIGKSNNDLYGISVSNGWKRDKWFIKARYTNQQYADYRVPAESFDYLSYVFPIYNGRLKNTAGKENTLSGTVQYTGGDVETAFHISNMYQKNGFFAGAHGIPSLSNLADDGRYRNIEYPYTNANHFKIINNTSVRLSSNLKWLTDVGFQNNHRQEWSYFHTHFGDAVQPPAVDPELELDFDLKTYTLDTKLINQSSEEWSNTAGLQSEYQQNRIGGYSFFLPRFNQFTVGGYWLTTYQLTPQIELSGGLRYDFANVTIDGYYDKNTATYLEQRGYSTDTVNYYAQRAYDTEKSINNFSGALGIKYEINAHNTFKANLGRSFRFPTAIEMAANGIHHGAFRHEQGNPDLDAEIGYQLDLGYTKKERLYEFSITPFASYFNNYIFLAPRDWSILPDAGLIYEYQQAKAVMLGGEYSLQVNLPLNFSFGTTGQYVYNKNLDNKQPLPFTPPLSLKTELGYENKYKFLQSYKLNVEHQFFAAQNKIAVYEGYRTPSASLFNAGASANILIENFRFSVYFQIQNIFDTPYYNHISFYRTINLPEPGRNVQLQIRIPFYINLK